MLASRSNRVIGSYQRHPAPLLRESTMIENLACGALIALSILAPFTIWLMGWHV